MRPAPRPAYRSHFYPRPPRGGRLMRAVSGIDTILFLSTPSARRATPELGVGVCIYRISIHALREEGDHRRASRLRRGNYFYPRPPRGGRHLVVWYAFSVFIISIHALREEGDGKSCAGKRGFQDFYPRPPRGGRLKRSGKIDGAILFLSTPSARRATRRRRPAHSCGSISIHALREEGDTKSSSRSTERSISIHALREEGDTPIQQENLSMVISIHALREEGDNSNLIVERVA